MDNKRNKKGQFDVDRQHSDRSAEFKNRPADQSGDNDMDRINPNTDKAKEETDKAYLRQGNKPGGTPGE